MQQVMCRNCFRWTVAQVASDVSFWFVCWECLGIVMLVREWYTPPVNMWVSIPLPSGSSVTGASSHS